MSPVVPDDFGPIKIEYVAGKGVRGVFVSEKGSYGNEQEIVVDIKSMITIIGAKVVDGVPYFVMRVDGIPD